MGLTSALNTSLNGLTLNETSIDVLGNNIANAGTNGFKSSTVLFTTQLSRTLSVGSKPTSTSGGTNPRQIGLGATTSAINKDFTQGGITNSTSPSDLAIQGEGFFIVRGPEGNVYSRNGNFTLSAKTIDEAGNPVASRLQNAQGLTVQGYGVDINGQIGNQLDDIEIPLGGATQAEQTTNVSIGGALWPTGELATQGSISLSEALSSTSGSAASVTPISAATLLVSVYPDGGTTALFSDGQVVTFSAKKGGGAVTPQSLTVDAATTTVGDLLTLMDETIGIHSGGTIPNDPNSGGQPGISVNAGGQIQVVGNFGTVNDIVVSSGDILADGVTVPIAFTKTESADGEGALTDFVVFDSLGTEIVVTLRAVLEARDNVSTQFRYYVDSFDDSSSDVVISNGIIEFDGNGDILAGGTGQIAINRTDTPAISPMQIEIDMSGVSGISSAAAGSTLDLDSQNGSGAGTLTNFVISETGVINGLYDNGVIETLGQIALARFSNQQGLVEAGNGTFREGVSSGPAQVKSPGSFGVGTIRAGAIELSNTDIGRNLVDLIVASTNYRGNARVISSVQQLVDELLVLGR